MRRRICWKINGYLGPRALRWLENMRYCWYTFDMNLVNVNLPIQEIVLILVGIMIGFFMRFGEAWAAAYKEAKLYNLKRKDQITTSALSNVLSQENINNYPELFNKIRDEIK